MANKIDADAEHLMKRIPLISEIKDRSLRERVVSIYVKMWRESKWKTLEEQRISTLPTSQLEHLNGVIEIAFAAAKILNRIHNVNVNLDYVLAGAILHDASKFAEYEKRGDGQGKSRFGELTQHGFETVRVATEFNLPLEVIHIVVSHTPASNVLPKTVEALIVYFSDALDYNFLRMLAGLAPDIRKPAA